MTQIQVKDSGFNVGDVVVGVGGYNMTYTEWYKIVRVTKCKVFLKEYPVSYATPYGPNTPGSHCMPEIDGVVDESCPYYFGSRELSDKEVSGIIRQWNGKHYIKLPGTYGMSLNHWDGRPGWVNCD